MKSTIYTSGAQMECDSLDNLPEDTLRYEIVPRLSGYDVSVLSRTCKALMSLFWYITDLRVVDTPVELVLQFSYLRKLSLVFSADILIALKLPALESVTIEALGKAKVTVSGSPEKCNSLKLINNVILCDLQSCSASKLSIVANTHLDGCLIPNTTFPNLTSVAVEGCSTNVFPDSLMQLTKSLHLRKARCNVVMMPRLLQLTMEDWDGEALPAAKRVPNLQVLRLKNTNVSSKKLSSYRSLRQLHLELFYSGPIVISGKLSNLEVLSIRRMKYYTTLSLSPHLKCSLVFIRSSGLVISSTIEADFPKTHFCILGDVIRSSEIH